MDQVKLGSLFDGSGGFPLAGVLNGIEPVWASEIEPFPIRVTKLRFPHMKHLGSVTDVNGAEVKPVDIITFGSPCQDLSVAGKQLGIHEGQRSSLFFEAIRIIKEMREHDRAIGRADHDVRPRFAVWENVPGAFSSNKGKDFQAVLQALCGIEGQETVVPEPPKGKWNPAGCIVGDGWSIAWRVYDAQFWGVPQRRKRIYLIADFGSERAGEILFERESVRWNPAESGTAWKGTPEDAERSAGRSDCIGFAFANSARAGLSCSGIAPTIKASRNGEPGCCAFMGGQGAKAKTIAYCDDGTAPTLRSAESGTNQVPDVVCLKGNWIDRETRQNGVGWAENLAYVLDATDRHGVAYGLSRSALNGGMNAGGMPIEEDVQPAIVARGSGAVCYDCRGNGDGKTKLKERDYKAGAVSFVLRKGEKNRKYIVRRLTPTECARLQGFPDLWCDGANGSDSAQYKLWGNGIALPCAYDVLKRIAITVEKGK